MPSRQVDTTVTSKSKTPPASTPVPRVEPRFIRIYGASQHNLKHVDVDIPRNAFVVVTGPSGSGKSSLAFDTLYAEGQRRYVESLSVYARQFLDQMQKPNVDHIEGMSPAIAIEQRSAGSNPRSIVATATEIYDYLRLLFAHIGHPHCPRCGQRVRGQSPQMICDNIVSLPAGRKLMILSPYIRGRKGEHREVLDKMRKEGFVRVRIDNEIHSLDEEFKLRKSTRHDIEAVVDRLITGKIDGGRLNDSIERALRFGAGFVRVLTESNDGDGAWHEELISEHLSCPDCSVSLGELLPRNFSFNSPYGACEQCHGLGTQNVVDDSLVIDEDRPLNNGAVPLWRVGARRMVVYHRHLLRCLAEHYDFPLDVPFKQLPDRIRNIVLHGSGEEEIDFRFRWGNRQRSVRKPFAGVVAELSRQYRETESQLTKERLRKVMTWRTCPGCDGARLRPESLAVTVGGHSVSDCIQMSVDTAFDFFNTLELAGEEALIADEILREIRGRLGFLTAVGLGYLTLNRESGTLAGGEAQRIRLATQVGSGLVGVLYVLDEPSIGLHQRDNHRLLDTLKRLRDLGNTVVVVEHDLDTIRAADAVIDLGPGAGAQGGEVVCAGTPLDIERCRQSLTGQYLAGTKDIPVPDRRGDGNGKTLHIFGARENNLRNIDVAIPLGTFCCVTGVSGSGKSTLVNTILTRAVNAHFKIGRQQPGEHTRIDGLDHIDKLIIVDQSPIGRTPRSNPATYTGAFDIIRRLFSMVPDARVRGYKPGRFSFNVKGGRCQECTGNGIKKIEMQFLPDVYVQCEVCKGRRYNRETLLILYKTRSISEVLDMTVDDACRLFKNVPKLHRILETLVDVGLGYIHLGQPATTLSGGEAQRVKLSTELARSQRGHTLYVFDEPTTGLHVDDIKKLLKVFMRLRDQGNTVLVIEHNLDVIKMADYIIDLGPEGGVGGGRIIAEGTPEAVARRRSSFTGKYLQTILSSGPSRTP